MNKIYKVIWSKVKNQYVVVSELAHSSGKQSRTAKRSLRSRIAALVVCGAIAAFGVYGVLPTQQAFANGAETTQSQYIAVGDANYTDADNYHRGEPYNPEKTYTQNIGGHTYVYTPTNDGNFWVRQGYTIEVIHDPRFTGAGGPDKNIIINAYRGENADTDGLVQSYQNVQESMNIHTLNGEELFSTNTSMYGGAVNTPTTGVTVVNPNDPNTLNEFIINEGTTALKGTTMIDVTGEKKSSYFQPVNYDSKTGLYHFGSISSSDNIVSTENLYVIDGIVGVFTKTPGGSSINDVYTGDVYGRNNEILMTGVDSKGNYVSYWGAEIVDPNAPIGSMPMSTLQGKFDEVEADIAKIHKDDISEIQVNHTEDGTAEDGKGGTIGLATNGGAMIPGGITVTSEATTGEDTKIKFENNKGSFTVNAGSRVVGKTGENVATEGGTLTSIDINGKNYLLGGGKTYSDGAGIKFEGTDNPTISVDLAENSGLHFVTENGEKKLVNNLKVETVSGDNQGGWKITETTAEKAQSKEFTNTTLDADYSNTTNNDADSDVNNSYKGSSETDDEGVVYGRDYVVKDTAGNTINLNDVASATTLQNVAGDVIENTESISNLTTTVEAGWTAKVGDDEINVKPNAEGEKDKDVLNFEAGNNIALTADAANNKITIGAEGVVSYDKVDGEYNTSSVTLGGDNNYTPASDNGETPASGGVKLTNVAYASGNDKSEAVNVDYLEDYVDQNGGGSWNLTTNKEEGATDKSVPIGKGNTVDFSGDGNITVVKTDKENNAGADITVNLNDNITLGEGENQIQLNGVPEGDEPAISVGDKFAVGHNGTISSTVTSGFGGSTTTSFDFNQNGVTISKNDDSSTNINGGIISIRNDENGQTTINGSMVTAGNIKLNSETDTSTIVGLSNMAWDDTVKGAVADSIEGRDKTEASKAATQAQLLTATDELAGDISDLSDFAVKYDVNDNGTPDTSDDTPDYSKVTLGNETYNFETGEGGTTITNLRPGDISPTSTDAVNGSQLYTVQQEAGRHTEITVNGGVAAPDDGTYTHDEQGHLDGNLLLKQSEGTNGQTVYDLKLNPDITLQSEDDKLETQDNRVELSGTNGTIMATTDFNDMSATTTINGGNVYVGNSVSVGDKVVMTNEDITGLSNTNWDGTTDNVSRAATEGQLQTVSKDVASLNDGAVKYWKNEDGSYDKSFVQLEGGEDGTLVTHVRDGAVNEYSSDAVNGSQLWETQQQIEEVQTEAGKHTTVTVNGGSFRRQLTLKEN